MVSLEEATDRLIHAAKPIRETEQVELSQATGRILAEDMAATTDQPPFARSPLDGYAVRGADVAEAGRDHPVILQIRGSVWAGQVYEGTVGCGEAVQIMTGAPIPDGADTVIRQEDTDRGTDRVSIYVPSAPWENYCPAGEDYRAGTLLLRRGTVLKGASIALLAGLGMARVPVFRKPRTGVLSTGDELVFPGNPLRPGQIYNTNCYYLQSRLTELGAAPEWIFHVEDETEEIADLLEDLSREPDLVVTTGGVSVGDRDRMPEVLSRMGAELLFQGVRLKPGAPAMAARLGRTILLCLSGNPYAAAATFELLARPVLSQLTGNSKLSMTRERAVLKSDYPKRGGVRRFLRGTVEDGEVRIAAGNQASGALSALADSNCLVEIPPESEGARKGAEVWVHLL